MTTSDQTPPAPQPDDREDLALEAALAALDVKDGHVHTFVQAGPQILLGADWKLGSVREAFQAYGAEIAGPGALAMNHGVSVRDVPNKFDPADLMTVFFATRVEWTNEQLTKQGAKPL